MPDVSNLAQFPELISDARIEPVWARLRQELHLPDEVEFATYEQPPQTIEKRSPEGIVYPVDVPAKAIFLVVSPNPHERLKGQTIKTFAFAELDYWREMEGNRWRYVGVPDPCYPIFKSLCRQHLEARKNFEELI